MWLRRTLSRTFSWTSRTTVLSVSPTPWTGRCTGRAVAARPRNAVRCEGMADRADDEPPRTGHDLHFLERLERVERSEAEQALRLYRDPALLRAMLADPFLVRGE